MCFFIVSYQRPHLRLHRRLPFVSLLHSRLLSSSYWVSNPLAIWLLSRSHPTIRWRSPHYPWLCFASVWHFHRVRNICLLHWPPCPQPPPFRTPWFPRLVPGSYTDTLFLVLDEVSSVNNSRGTHIH